MRHIRVLKKFSFINFFNKRQVIALLISIIASISFVFNASAELFTHTLSNQQAEDVIPIIQPHLSNNTSVTGKGFELFVNGSKEDNQKILNMLAMIDLPTRQYLVELRILDSAMSTRQLSSASLSLNESSTAQSSNPTGQVIKYQTQISDPKSNFYKINVIENTQVYIATGESFPNNQLESKYGSFLPGTGRTEIKNGFYLIVSRQGDQQVLLSLSAQQQQRQSQYGSSVTSSSTSTRVRGNLNQWILVASTSKDSSNQHNNRSVSSKHGIKTYKTSNAEHQSRWYYIRVTSGE